MRYVGKITDPKDLVTKEYVDEKDADKQDKLIAGTNITIAADGRTISASGSGGTTDFEELSNRPSYNGATMTHETDIPEVKTSAWDAKAEASDLNAHIADVNNPHAVTAAQVGAKATSNIEDIAHGGTGATTAAAARTNLGNLMSWTEMTEIPANASINQATYCVPGRYYGNGTQTDLPTWMEDTYPFTLIVFSAAETSTSPNGVQRIFIDEEESYIGIQTCWCNNGTWNYYDWDRPRMAWETIPVAQGGTGATTAAAARTNLGLGSLATLSTAPIANGGTGATTAADARTNLGNLASLTEINVVPSGVSINSPTYCVPGKYDVSVADANSLPSVMEGNSQIMIVTGIGSDTTMAPGSVVRIWMEEENSYFGMQYCSKGNDNVWTYGDWCKYSPFPITLPVLVSCGGTGATNAAGARANLGLGSLATLSAVPTATSSTVGGVLMAYGTNDPSVDYPTPTDGMIYFKIST